jgi:hypothetical protein
VTQPAIKSKIVDFFKAPGARVAISRESISRLCNIAFPTLDVALESLKAEGILELAPPEVCGMWRPTRSFSFTLYNAEAEKKKALRAEERKKRFAARAAKAAVAAQNYLKTPEQLSIKQARRRQTSDERIAKALADKAVRDEARRAREEKWAAHHAARAQERAELKAFKEAQRQEKVLGKIGLPQNSDHYKPPVDEPVRRVERDPNDPWTIIRARTYSKPQYLGSSLEQLTPLEKMRGRCLR